MTVAAPPSSPAGSGPSDGAHALRGDAHLAVPQRVAGGDACPLCGTPLSPEQDWCLRCGAAARTRLAATPNWRAPIATVAVVAALALAVLAAALVKLAGGSGSSSTPTTATVTTPAASTPATPTTAVPGATVAPGAIAPTPTTPTVSTPGATITTTPTTPGATTPNPGGATTKTGALGKSFPGLTPAEREALRKFNKRAAGR